MYKLHCFSQSGNAYKVAVLLQALGVPWTPLQLPVDDDTTGEIPILETGGRKLTQPGAIMVYLAEKHGTYGGRDDEERQEVLRWLLFDNQKFTLYFATWRFMKSFAPVPPDPVIEKWLCGRIDSANAIVERHLAGREYVVGTAPTLADISLCGYLFFPSEESGYDIGRRYPAMSKWLQRLKTLPGWKPPYEMLPGAQSSPCW
jgi:glutathione S-transferase